VSAQAITLELVGAKELQQLLKNFAEKTGKKALRKGCRAGAKIITAACKAAVPKRTGLWASQIKTRALVRSRKNKYLVGARTTVGAKGWYQGKAFYAAFAEFGHKRGKRPGGSTPDTRAAVEGKHYMELATHKTANQAGQEVINVAAAEIERTAAAG